MEKTEAITAEDAAQVLGLKACPACGSYSTLDAETCDEVVRTPWGLVVCGYQFGERH